MKLTRDEAAYYGVLGIVGAFGVIDWPVLAAIGVGHWLIKQSRSPALADIGEVLEDV